MLRALRECCTAVYLVCNFPAAESGLEYVEPYVDHIWYRENRGYDSGAYKDALEHYIGWETVYGYDELLLTNDSYWGPFYPLDDFFRHMAAVDCDYWGLTGQGPGELLNPIYTHDAHTHSYFMVFRSQVLHSPVFRKFWEEFCYPQTFREAIVNYEIVLNAYLRQNGFQGAAFLDYDEMELKRNEISYYLYPYEMIKDRKFPVLKKKTLLMRNPGFPSALKAIQYLRENHLYPTKWIEPYVDNQFYISEDGTEEHNSLETFYRTHSKIYIYGNGVCGKSLKVYFAYKGWHYDGVIVSTPGEEDVDVMTLENADIRSDTGIIISVINRTAASDIAAYIGNRCTREQLFFISECKTIQIPD
jgi:rhamnosyltransferase